MQLKLKKHEQAELWGRPKPDLKRMVANLVKYFSTQLGENEPLEVHILTAWSMQRVDRGGITGTLLQAATIFVTERFLPDSEDGTPIDDEVAQDAIREVAVALMSEIDEVAHNQALRDDVMKAIVRGTPHSSSKVSKLLERFQLEGGLGGTLPGREARRDMMQMHLRKDEKAVFDPMPPVVPANELRCPQLPEEPKSPQSLHCHQCRRVVGGGASGDEGNQALVS